jgi:biotin carboxyl carrier protein
MDVAQLHAQRSADSSQEAHLSHGEGLAVPERVILAPIAGSFRPVAEAPGEGDSAIDAEQVIGFVEGQGQSAAVRSPFGGLLMGLLAHAGERVREGQPVAWLRVA